MVREEANFYFELSNISFNYVTFEYYQDVLYRVNGLAIKFY